MSFREGDLVVIKGWGNQGRVVNLWTGYPVNGPDRLRTVLQHKVKVRWGNNPGLPQWHDADSLELVDSARRGMLAGDIGVRGEFPTYDPLVARIANIERRLALMALMDDIGADQIDHLEARVTRIERTL